VNWPLQIFLYVLFFELETRGRNALWFGVLSTVGVVAVWGGIAAYFRARNSFDALVYNVLTHNLEYINAVPWGERLKLCEKTLGDLFQTEGVAWALAIIGVIAICRARRTGLLWFVAQWLIGSLAGVSASGYFFPHYFQQWLPVLCVMAALGAEAVAKAQFWEKTPGFARCAVVGLGVLAVPAFFIAPFFVRQTPDEASRKIYPGSHCPEMREMGRRLAEITKPEERVYVFGAEAETLFYARRVSATRYIFLFPLYGPYRDAREKQMATAEEIATNKPAALLYLPNNLFLVKGTEQFLTLWTQAYMKENFRGDLWLAVDQNGKGRLLTGGEGIRPPRVEAGERVVGGLFVRVDRSNAGGLTRPE
jgi:hypothetical protein